MVASGSTPANRDLHSIYAHEGRAEMVAFGAAGSRGTFAIVGGNVVNGK